MPYYKLGKFAYGKCGKKIYVRSLSFRSGVAQYSYLLECDAAPIRHKALRSSETPITTYQFTQCNIPEVANLQ